MQRTNEALVVTAVAERAPGRADARAECALRNDTTVPNRVEQFVLADASIAVANEVDKRIEYLRLDVNNRAGAPHLVPRDIDLEIGEAEFQAGPLATIGLLVAAKRRPVK